MTIVHADRPDKTSSVEREAYGWMMKFAENAAQESDLTELRAWLAERPEHRAAYEQVNRVWDGFGHAGLQLAPEELAALEADARGATKRLARRAVLGGCVTAGVAGVAALGVVNPPLGLWPSWTELHANYRTAVGEQRHVTLPNGVAISVNTRTSIALRSSRDQAAGIELINGEAMIATAPTASAPFIVVAANGRVVATEARFNIWCDDKSVCVTCLSGGLIVRHRAAGVTLLANQQVVYTKVEIGPAAMVDPVIVTSWLSGMVVFRLTPISQVVEVINRYRPGKVILTNAALGRRLMSARFRIQDIDGTIGQIQQVFGAHVTVLPGGVTLLS